MPVPVAAIQFEPRQFAHAENIAALRTLVERAARDGARPIVTPEMGTTGYCWFNRAEVRPFVEPIPGPTTETFAEVAARHDCYIVIGMPEVCPQTDLFYNAAVLIGPQGVIGRHRKTHPYIAEPKWAAPGDVGHQVFATPIGRLALLICMDIHFIETARLVALQGCEVICHISNWLAERTPAPYWISRAYENGCYLIESNRWGLERTVQFSGGSCVIAPDGSILASRDGGDGVVHAAIDLDRVRGGALAGRRPEHYAMLMSHPFGWNPLDYFGLCGHARPPPGRRSRIAVGQLMPAPSVADNLATIAALLAEAGPVDLLVLPELALTGPYRPGSEIPLSDAAIGRLLALAARHRAHLVVGLAEREGTDIYNSAILVGPEGLVGCARKIHLGAAERAWARPGEGWVWFDILAGRLGLLLGDDAAFPEAARCLAVAGCDIIACPAAVAGVFTGGHAGSVIAQNYPIPTGGDPHHWHHFRVRAGENNCYLAFANWLDPDRGYLGKSGVFGPETFAFPRQESAILDDAGVAATWIDTRNADPVYPTNVVRRKDLLCMRLPHHYRPLIEPTPPRAQGD
jgi:predicted amidohydrolase